MNQIVDSVNKDLKVSSKKPRQVLSDYVSQPEFVGRFGMPKYQARTIKGNLKEVKRSSGLRKGKFRSKLPRTSESPKQEFMGKESVNGLVMGALEIDFMYKLMSRYSIILGKSVVSADADFEAFVRSSDWYSSKTSLASFVKYAVQVCPGSSLTLRSVFDAAEKQISATL